VNTRINRDGIKKGYATSQSIPLSRPDFYNHIEEGIKPLVLALRSKGYFTLSSCEGHSLHDYAEVVIALPTIYWVEALIKLKTNLKFCSVTSCLPEEYMEREEAMSDSYKEIPRKRTDGDNSTRNKMDSYESVKVLNHLFDRNYARYTLIFIRVIPTLKELPLPFAWAARHVLGSYLVKKAARIIDKKLEVFDG
jgi:hypothetical protein